MVVNYMAHIFIFEMANSTLLQNICRSTFWNISRYLCTHVIMHILKYIYISYTKKCIAISYMGIYGSQIYGSYKLPYMCHIYFDIFETANFVVF